MAIPVLFTKVPFMDMNYFNPGYLNEIELKNIGFKSIGKNVQVAKNCTIIGVENISLGNNVRIDGYSTIIVSAMGYLNVGSNIHIGGYCAIFAGAGVTMEDFSGLSQSVKIYSTSDDYTGKYMTNPTVPAEFTNVHRAPVFIGRHAIVGSQSIIMPGVSIAEGSAVGANSLVSKDTEAWSVYFGSPAKKIKNRSKNILELEKEYLSRN